MGDKKWVAPACVLESDELARPGYAQTKAAEYLDDPEVLSEKVKLLAALIQQSRFFTTYTGAGLSTSSGIDDYATHSKDSFAANKPKLRSPLDARPTIGHRVLAALYQAGYLRGYIQQNHDGLPQKAGVPQEIMNEIHGAWFDPSNPVVPMKGQLRGDLFDWLLDWELTADLVLVLGTSLSGMNADRMCVTPAKRSLTDHSVLGSVIVSLQQTQHDEISTLRIFGTIDNVMSLLAKELDLGLDKILAEHKDGTMYQLKLPKHNVIEEDVFLLPYDENGEPIKTAAKASASSSSSSASSSSSTASALTSASSASASSSSSSSTSSSKSSSSSSAASSSSSAIDTTGWTKLDLRDDKKVRINIGPFAGDVGVMMGRNKDGHYRIQFRHEIKSTDKNSTGKSFAAPVVRLFGSWFMESASKGLLPVFPISSIK